MMHITLLIIAVAVLAAAPVSGQAPAPAPLRPRPATATDSGAGTRAAGLRLQTRRDGAIRSSAWFGGRTEALGTSATIRPTGSGRSWRTDEVVDARRDEGPQRLGGDRAAAPITAPTRRQGRRRSCTTAPSRRSPRMPSSFFRTSVTRSPSRRSGKSRNSFDRRKRLTKPCTDTPSCLHCASRRSCCRRLASRERGPKAHAERPRR